MGLGHEEGWSIPFDHPFYPPLPAHYRNVVFQMVYFQAALDAVARLLPAPLEPAPSGLCLAMGLRIPFSTAYGPFCEAVVQEQCVFRGQTGWYCSHVWHDGPSGIAAGREIYGTPKVFAVLKVRQVERAMTTTAAMGGLPVVTISSTLEARASPADVPPLAPAWRLKVIPRADGPGPALKQLVDCAAATQDLEVHQCWAGRGVVRFEPTPQGDVSGLRPLAYHQAFQLEASYTEGYARIAYDYLAGQ
ncbi:MAG: acetoacetate decarboxylase family protein [Candidatus Latescibacterota bacterium]